MSDVHDRRFLIRVAVVSSAETLTQLNKLAPQPPWILGDPTQGSTSWLRERSGQLLGARQEARIVAAFYPNSRLLLDEMASESQLRRLPAGADVQIAAHMMRDPSDEQQSYIALGASTQDDGRLYTYEVQRLQGARALVVLRGCSSQRGAIVNGGALSMARAWHKASAQQVLVSR